MDLRNVYKLFKKKKNFFRGRYLRNKSERQKKQSKWVHQDSRHLIPRYVNQTFKILRTDY